MNPNAGGVHYSGHSQGIIERTGFSLLTDRYRIGTLKVAAPEITRGQGQEYIAALMPSLKGIRIAKLGWQRRDLVSSNVQVPGADP